MKIVFTTHTYWPRKDGVQYVTQYMAEGLVKRGHQVVVFAPQGKSKETITEEHNGVRIIRPFFKQKFTLYFGKNRSYKEALLDQCKDSDCMINCAVQSPFNNFVLPLLSNINVQKVLYLHGVYDYRFPQNMRAKAIIKKALLNVRWFLFYHRNASRFSRYDKMINITQDSLNSNFFKKIGVFVPTYIINNAVEDFDKVKQMANVLERLALTGKKYFLNVANFNERKNQLMLIKAYAEFYKKTNMDVHLVLIGGTIGTDGYEYANECKALISELNCKSKIHFLENMPREDTKVLIKSCYCAVMSSTYEVYPIFLAESLSCAHPFISTNVGSVNQMAGGIVVNNCQEFVRSMIKITSDDNCYHDLMIEGKEYAQKHFSQEEKIIELEKVLID